MAPLYLQVRAAPTQQRQKQCLRLYDLVVRPSDKTVASGFCMCYEADGVYLSDMTMWPAHSELEGHEHGAAGGAEEDRNHRSPHWCTSTEHTQRPG